MQRTKNGQSIFVFHNVYRIIAFWYYLLYKFQLLHVDSIKAKTTKMWSLVFANLTYAFWKSFRPFFLPKLWFHVSVSLDLYFQGRQISYWLCSLMRYMALFLSIYLSTRVSPMWRTYNQINGPFKRHINPRGSSSDPFGDDLENSWIVFVHCTSYG